MTYRELITAIRTAGPVIITTHTRDQTLYCEAVKVDLVEQLTRAADGDLDAESQWEIHKAGNTKYLESV